MVLNTRILAEYVRSMCCSQRCAAWVAEAFLDGNVSSRKAREHLARNGGFPSERAVFLLDKISRMRGLDLDLSVLLWVEEPGDDNSHAFTPPIDWADHMEALKLCNEAEYALEVESLRKAGAEWWEREGKYEAAAEDQGTYKDYLWACKRADQFNEPHPHISEFARL